MLNLYCQANKRQVIADDEEDYREKEYKFHVLDEILTKISLQIHKYEENIFIKNINRTLRTVQMCLMRTLR